MFLTSSLFYGCTTIAFLSFDLKENIQSNSILTDKWLNDANNGK